MILKQLGGEVLRAKGEVLKPFVQFSLHFALSSLLSALCTSSLRTS